MTDYFELRTDFLAAQMWARELLADRDSFVILDTETTGLGKDAEIVEISVIDGHGRTLMDSLVKPTGPIPLDSYRVHRISDEMVADAPTFDKLIEQLHNVLGDKRVIVYNANYDSRLVAQSAELRGVRFTRKHGAWECAMQQYARFFGEYNDWHNSYRWQSLVNACNQLAADPPDAPAHRALGDCLRTLQVLEGMAAIELDDLQGLFGRYIPTLDEQHSYQLLNLTGSGSILLRYVDKDGKPTADGARGSKRNLAWTPAGWRVHIEGLEFFTVEASR